LAAHFIARQHNVLLLLVTWRTLRLHGQTPPTLTALFPSMCPCSLR
jgi:hypothetical protein